MSGIDSDRDPEPNSGGPRAENQAEEPIYRDSGGFHEKRCHWSLEWLRKHIGDRDLRPGDEVPCQICGKPYTYLPGHHSIFEMPGWKPV